MKNELTVPNGEKWNKSESGGGRQSNLELFGIVTMLFIIAHHYVVNSGVTKLVYASSLDRQALFMLMAGAWGKTGINCFIILSAYFMCEKEITAQKIVKLVAEIIFYKTAFYLIFCVTGYTRFTVGQMRSALLPITAVGGDFVSAFLLFYLFIPFLNIFIRHLNEKLHIRLILLCLFIYTVMGTIPWFTVTMNYVSWFIVLYFIGAYLRLYPKPIFDNFKLQGTLFLLSVIAAVISIHAFAEIYWASADRANSPYYPWALLSDCNRPLAVLVAVTGFLFFKNLKIGYHKWINTISASTFGVLLIHANSNLMRQWLWVDTLKVKEYYKTPWTALHMAGSVLGILLVATVIDQIRIHTIEKSFLRLFQRMRDRAAQGDVASAGCGVRREGEGINNMLQKLKKNRFLCEELVKRDFKKKYKRTVLGMAWSILSPLIMLLVMKLVFTNFFGRNTPHYTIYLFCGNIIFSYFNESTTQGMSSLMGNALIFTKVNVPKYLFLLSKNVQCLINFGLTLCVFVIFCIFDRITFTWKFIFLLYPIIGLVLFNIGMGLILSALFVFFRDIQYLWGIFTQLLMYMSAIFYTIDSYSQRTQNLFLLNPVYLFIRYFRKIVIEAVIPTPQFHLLIAADVLLAVGIGSWMYKKYNTRFLYYV